MKFRIERIESRIGQVGPADENGNPVKGAKRTEIKLSQVMLSLREGPSAGLQVQMNNVPKAFLGNADVGDHIDLVMGLAPAPAEAPKPAEAATSAPTPSE